MSKNQLITDEKLNKMVTAAEKSAKVIPAIMAAGAPYGVAAGTNVIDELKRNFNTWSESHDERFGLLQEQVDQVEAIIQRPGTTQAGGCKDREALNRWAGFIRTGRNDGLQNSPDTSGGYIAPAQFVSELIKNIVRFSPVRQLAFVGQAQAGSVILPRRTSGPTGMWVSETGERPETTMTFGQIEIQIREMACYVDVSNALLEDAAVDINMELVTAFGEEFGRMEGQAFISGDTIQKPEGLLHAAGVSEVVSGNATQVKADALIEMFLALSPVYRSNAHWLMSSATLASIRKLKDGAGNYLITTAGMSDAVPNLLLGRGVIECEDMPVIAESAFPIIFGDIFEAYRVYDRITLSTLRDPFSVATTGRTRFHCRRRLGAGVVKPEAYLKMKISA